MEGEGVRWGWVGWVGGWGLTGERKGGAATYVCAANCWLGCVLVLGSCCCEMAFSMFEGIVLY